ncbi:MAG: NAD(P)-dependent oxidoreductase [Acidimicrobiia bacterium]|nr:NAD(P)-dependent oxidoreductase [Acidimicrobiia bacterium]
MRPSVIVAPHFRTMEEIFRPGALDRLGSFAEVVWGLDSPMPQDRFEAALEDATAVVFGTWHYGDSLVRGAPNLRAVLEVAGAHDHQAMGYEECFNRGIEVGSVAHAFGPAVAELTLGLTFAATRGIAKNDRDFRSSQELWLHEGNVGYNTMFDKVVGFVGCGGLSVELQRLLRPFGVRILGFDPFLPDEAMHERGIERADLETMFRRSDVVYVLAAPTATSRGMIDRRLLELLEPHQTLIMTSRAALVDFDALTELVVEGRFRLGVDVFPEEPLPADHPLRAAESVVLSSHRAGAVPDALLAIGDMIVDDLEAIITNVGERRMQYLTRASLESLLQPGRE